MAVALRTAPAGGFLMRSTSTRLVLASWQYNLLRISEYWGSAEREETCMLWSADQPESGADVENFSFSLKNNPKLQLKLSKGTQTESSNSETDYLAQVLFLTLSVQEEERAGTCPVMSKPYKQTAALPQTGAWAGGGGRSGEEQPNFN